MRYQGLHVLGVWCLCLLGWSGCKPATGVDASAVAQVQEKSPALATMTDQDRVLKRLEQVNNPHLFEAAQYLTTFSTQETDEVKRAKKSTLSPNAAMAPGPQKQERIQAYPLMAALWPNPAIEVCWENPQPAFSRYMNDVRSGIEHTWQAASKLRFTGWLTCPASSSKDAQVIRIQVDDKGPNDGPRTLGLGRQLAGIQHGMLLNFTFLRWGMNCQTMTEYCIKAIAVHEFGHAIGFAHEQNRPDKPGECMEKPQGTNGDNATLTPYDPSSVMNYCNKEYNNNGELSALDVAAVQALYGRP